MTLDILSETRPSSQGVDCNTPTRDEPEAKNQNGKHPAIENEQTPPEPTLGELSIGEDARLAQTLIDALVQRIDAEKLDPRSVLVDSEIKAIAKKAKIKLSHVRHDFEKQTKNAEQSEQIENPEFGHLIKEDDPFTPEEQQAAQALLMELNLFSVFADDFILTGYKARRERTDGGLQLLGRTLRATSSGEYGHGH